MNEAVNIKTSPKQLHPLNSKLHVNIHDTDNGGVLQYPDICLISPILCKERPGYLEFLIIIYLCSIYIYICMLRIVSSAWCAVHPNMEIQTKYSTLSELGLYRIIYVLFIHFV